ncbi:MAG TPA: hypothetical protein VEB59_03540 [Gemmatimonadales bacterium]|nr:hypothetical protein [Gemmatimonadales bacterium]
MRAIRFGPIPTLALLLALGACGEEVRSPTEPVPGPAIADAAAALSFHQVSGGDVHTCGLTSDGLAWCWGDNGGGRLGTGSETGPEDCSGVGGAFACGMRPAAVAGGRAYRQISAGDIYTCAVATDARAYCWGSGALGDGTVTDGRATPAVVQGGLRFYQVDVGSSHACGVSNPDRRVYCWGSNSRGQLGDGSLTDRLLPVPVASDRAFRQVSAGSGHTCAVTTANEAFCWGFDDHGQLGNDDVKARRTRPVRVAGGHRFRQLDAGWSHTCAITTLGKAFCWGQGGRIGDGKILDRFTPRAVLGGQTFDRVSAGGFHTCGETTTNRVYCWGSNSFGQLGNDGGSDGLTPVAVAGGLTFAQVSAGGFHTCGRTGAGAAYCWGYGFFGQLGTGESGFEAERSAPEAVVSPS